MPQILRAVAKRTFGTSQALRYQRSAVTDKTFYSIRAKPGVPKIFNRHHAKDCARIADVDDMNERSKAPEPTGQNLSLMYMSPAGERARRGGGDRVSARFEAEVHGLRSGAIRKRS